MWRGLSVLVILFCSTFQRIWKILELGDLKKGRELILMKMVVKSFFLSISGFVKAHYTYFMRNVLPGENFVHGRCWCD